MRKNLRALGMALAVPLAYMIIQQIVSVLCYSVYGSFWMRRNTGGPEELRQALADYWIQNGLILLLAAALLGIVLAVLLIRREADTAHLFRIPDRSSAAHLILFGLSANLLISFLLGFLPFPDQLLEEYGQMSEMLTGQNLVIHLAVACLIVPVAEELIHRGLSYRILRRTFSMRTAIVVQALIFTVFHGNPIQMIGVFPMALALGLVYEWSGTLASSILLHIVFNCSNILLSLLLGFSDRIGLGVWFILAITGTVVSIRSLHRHKIADNVTISE